MKNPRVVISHSGKQYSYQTALALQEVGLLKKYITSLYYKPSEFPYNLVSKLPKSLSQKLNDKLLKRKFEVKLNGNRIVSVPYFELIELFIKKIPSINKIIDPNTLRNVLFDRYVSKYLINDCDIFHSFDGCALYSFKKAKEKGIITILDLPIVSYNYSYILKEEYEKHGKKWEIKGTDRKDGELELADYILVPSDFVVSSLIDKGIKQEKIIKIPYGVSLEKFDQCNTKKRDNIFRIIFVGSIGVRKGVHYLLEAYKQLSLPNSELVLVGYFSGDEKWILEKYSGIYKHIGKVSYDELPQYLKSSDIFVFPSLLEGSALITYDAMACRLPSIVTENAGSIVRDGIDGFVIPIKSVEALKEKILTLYKNKELRITMGENARKYVDNYTWDKYRQRVSEVIKDIFMKERGEK